MAGTSETLTSWKGGIRAAIALGAIAVGLYVAFPNAAAEDEVDEAVADLPAGVYVIQKTSWNPPPPATDGDAPPLTPEEQLRIRIGEEAQERWDAMDIAYRKGVRVDVR